MNFAALFALSIGLLVLSAIFWVTARSLRGTDRGASELRRYAAFEAEENSLLVPIFMVLGGIGAVVGGIGMLLD